ncbi:PIR protein, putative [Plasmodium sp.]|nr:PIR protein, putative [Plasmodium sp.]
MKIHYINILLFAHSLNILVSSPKNLSITLHTRINKPTKPHRLLCECELYALQNYDNDVEMKKVKKNFDRQTSQRFEEYNERMIKNKYKCKDQCDKDIQKIILKDKIEKELTEKFSTLDTNLTTKDIPTCVCKKSLADKTENFCLKCGYELGGGVLQSIGLLGGIGQLGLNAWKTAALAAAEKAAMVEGAEAGKIAGDIAGAAKFIDGLRTTFYINKLGVQRLESLFTAKTYTNVSGLPNSIYMEYSRTCLFPGINTGSDPMCPIIEKISLVQENVRVEVSTMEGITKSVKKILAEATNLAESTKANMTSTTTATLTKQKTSEIAATYVGYQTTIIASIVAILVIVLVMVIIYLILRHRRKKKMKKKLQYIKLLKE